MRIFREEKNKYNSFFITKFGYNDYDNQFKIQYHYTSPDAFLSIIKNEQVRFTDIRFLNDKSEGIYLVKLMCDYFNENKQKFPRVEEAFDNLISKNHIESIRNLSVSKIIFDTALPIDNIRHFVFCMCEECDMLNMWNYYVNNGLYQGYNIGINVLDFLKTFDVESKNLLDAFTVYYGKVLYKEQQQFKELENLFYELENENNFEYIGVKLKLYIDTYCAFFKHAKFENEKEFRIVIEISDKRIPRADNHFVGINNKLMEYNFCTKNGLIVPYLAVKINKDSFSRITVSPIMEAEITQNSIRELLKTNDFKGCKVYQSNIPIRF